MSASPPVVTTANVLKVSTRLLPTIRISAHQPGLDVATRLGECLAGFVRDPQLLDQLLAGIDPNAPLFEVADAAQLYATLGPKQRVATRTSSATLAKLLESVLAPPVGEVTSEKITCLVSDDDQRPVVLVRETSALTEQYLFPRVTVDTTTGRISFAPASAPAHRGIIAHDGWQTGQQIVGAAMAVTPFLPAPFGPIITGGLSVINLIFGLAADGKQSTKSPLDDAVTAIENFVNDTALKGFAGSISAQTGEFTHAMKAQTQDINALADVDGGLTDFRDSTQYTWIPGVVTPNGQLFTFLKGCDVTNFDKTLSLLVSGITTELVMYHALVAVNAADASIQFRHRSLRAYGSAVTKVTGAAGTAANDIGTWHVGDWGDDEMTTTIEDDTAAYIPRIDAWMAKARKDRMAQISTELIRIDPFKEKKQDPEGYDASTVHVGGWTFTDSSIGGDNGRLANVVWDTETDDCNPKTTEQKAQAQTKLDNYRNSINAGIDNSFAPHRDKMGSWITYLTSITDLMPPGLPSIPTVTLATSGTATPAGDWKDGDQVRYALMAKSDHGPSPASDWCKEITISGCVGATIGGITPVPGAKSIVVLRQFRPKGGDWGDVEQAAALAAPFPDTYTDITQGGDPW